MSSHIFSWFLLLACLTACSDGAMSGEPVGAAPEGAPIAGAPIDGAPAGETSTEAEKPQVEGAEDAESGGEAPYGVAYPEKAADVGEPEERPMNDFKTAPNPAQHRVNLPGALEKGKKPLVPNDKGIIEVSFGHLASFPYLVPDPFLGEEEPEVENEIPARIQALDGKQVQVEGYMIPLDFNDSDEVTLFILSAFVDNCCFGKQANVNEWVEVELGNDQGVEFYPDGIVQVTGVLEVGELKDSYGYVSGIYRMKAKDVVEVW
ncbi:MAG: DUF3299 domain-containing protein [Planctomycetota bacterium]